MVSVILNIKRQWQPVFFLLMFYLASTCVNRAANFEKCSAVKKIKYTLKSLSTLFLSALFLPLLAYFTTFLCLTTLLNFYTNLSEFYHLEAEILQKIALRADFTHILHRISIKLFKF